MKLPDKFGEERFFRQIAIMFFQHFFSALHEFQSSQFESSFFKLANYISHQVAMDSVGLEQNQGLFIIFVTEVSCWSYFLGNYFVSSLCLRFRRSSTFGLGEVIGKKRKQNKRKKNKINGKKNIKTSVSLIFYHLTKSYVGLQ